MVAPECITIESVRYCQEAWDVTRFFAFMILYFAWTHVTTQLLLARSWWGVGLMLGGPVAVCVVWLLR